MKLFYLILLLLLITSCAKNSFEIKTSSAEKANVKDAYIRTTKIEIDNEQEIPKPAIDIVNLKDGEIVKDGKILVLLNISNFRLVTPDTYPRKGQGHVQVWVDGMEFRSAKTEFVFENESNGTHIIKAELLLSNNTVLPYSKTINIIVNRT